MSTALATALRAVRDRLAKLPRSQRWVAGGVVGAILVAAVVAPAALASPAPSAPAAQPTATRVDQRANRSEVRTTPSATPSATATPTPKATTAPPPRPPATTKAAPKPTVTRTATTRPVPRAAGCSGYTGAKLTACNLLPTFGFATSQMAALVPMWQNESGWNYAAANGSGAYGIPQALPGSKMATYGSDWRTNPATQIKWGLSYIKSRYGSPSAAWSFWQSHGWY